MIELVDGCPSCGRQCTAVTRQGDSVRVEFWACRHDMRVQVPHAATDAELAAVINRAIGARLASRLEAAS